MTPAAIHCGRAPEVRAARYDPAPPHTDDPEMWMRAASVSDIGRVNGAPHPGAFGSEA